MRVVSAPGLWGVAADAVAVDADADADALTVPAEIMATANYVCPVPAAQHVLASSKDEDTAALAENPLIFPNATMRKRLAIAREITSTERTEFAKRWNTIAGL